MPDLDEEISTRSYWPSVADLFLTLFIIAIAIIAVVVVVLSPTSNIPDPPPKEVEGVGVRDLKDIRDPLNELRKALKKQAIPPDKKADVVFSELRANCSEASKLIISLARLLEQVNGGVDSDKKLAYENQELLAEVSKLKKQLQEIERQLASQLVNNDKPPIIQIRESEGGKADYRFESGSSEMNLRFIAGLANNEFRQLAEMILQRQVGGPNRVNTLEIIGHTDEVPLKNQRGRGNLDANLPEYLDGRVGIATLNPGSNNDLGLLRALAVKEQWQRFIEREPERAALQKIYVRCYSAGQTIPPVEQPAADDPGLSKEDQHRLARRIEMRLTLIESEDQGKRK